MSAAPAVLAVVQAGGQGSRVDVLTRERAKPTLPFGGCYQLVDIALSNLVHSGTSDVWLSRHPRARRPHRDGGPRLGDRPGRHDPGRCAPRARHHGL